MTTLYRTASAPGPNGLSDWLSARLTEYAAQFGIIGAAAALLQGDALAQAAAGVLNVSTGVTATPDALFQLGSITKTFTATLALQLLEQGRIELDAPVRKYLPDFGVASDRVSADLTVRHLLTHTSGIDGEFFIDTGTDSDCIQKYAQACRALGQIHAPGDSTSYCNAGFVVLGALLERVTGQSWQALLQERIIAPLGLFRTTTDYAELPRFRVAVGHVIDPASGKFAVSKRLHLPRGMGPTGATLHSSAKELAEFGRVFMRRGSTRSGAPILTPETIALALMPHADWPTARWTHLQTGLGWQLQSWGGRKTFGHDGVTFGQNSFLRVMPDADIVLALLTTGGQESAKNLYQALFGEVFQELAGVRPPGTPNVPVDVSYDAERMVGRYANASTQAEVFMEDGVLTLRVRMPQFAGLIPEQMWPLIPLSKDACLILNRGLNVQEILVFHHFDPSAETPRYASLARRDLVRLG